MTSCPQAKGILTVDNTKAPGMASSPFKGFQSCNLYYYRFQKGKQTHKLNKTEQFLQLGSFDYTADTQKAPFNSPSITVSRRKTSAKQSQSSEVQWAKALLAYSP